MCAYFCIGFIDFMLKGKGLLEYANLFSPNDYKKNAVSIENLKNLKYHTFWKKHQFFLLFAVGARVKIKNYLKKNTQLRYSKFLGHLKIYNYLKNMVEENISQEFKLKNNDEAKNYLIQSR